MKCIITVNTTTHLPTDKRSYDRPRESHLGRPRNPLVEVGEVLYPQIADTLGVVGDLFLRHTLRNIRQWHTVASRT